MKKELCKHHGLPKVSGHFCKKCQDDLQKTTDTLNKIFSKLVITMDSDGNPKIEKTPSPENV